MKRRSWIADEIFASLLLTGAWVPALWHLEVANTSANRHPAAAQRHAADFRDRMFSDLSNLPIHVDPETYRQAWGAAYRLAEKHGLMLYDSAYLELALRRGLALATFDKVREAAAREKSCAARRVE